MYVHRNLYIEPFLLQLIVVVVLTLTHRHNNTKQSVVAGQAPITLEWKEYLGSKIEAKTKKQAYAFHHLLTWGHSYRRAFFPNLRHCFAQFFNLPYFPVFFSKLSVCDFFFLLLLLLQKFSRGNFLR